MEKSTGIIISVGIFLIVIFLSFGLYETILGYSVSFEKCDSLTGNNADDCWHSLAHQTLNKTYCNEIKNNETKEHCFEHIPK